MKTLLLAALAVAVGLCTSQAQQQGAPDYKRLLRPADARMYHVPIALCEDYPEESTTPDIIRGDMEMLKRAGINVLRISFGWDGIEEKPGEYNWRFWDDYVKTAVDEYGITLIPYVCYTPSWNSTGDTTNFWNHTPKEYEAFGRFMEALVNRYKDRIKSWELWNEPDIKEYWSGTSADLAKLTTIGAQAVKRADPDAIVVLAGLAGHTRFLRELFRDHGISKFVDVVNCHSYYETWNGHPLEAVIPYVDTLSQIIKQYGNNQSLWMAEVGYSTYRKPDGYVSNSYRATYEYEHTPAFQAVAMWRTLAMLLSTNKMAAIAWYEIKDLPTNENVIGDVNNRNLGVDFLGWKPKPAESALKFFTEFFAGKSRGIDAQAKVTRPRGSESQVHTFEMEDGSLAVVAWLKTNIPGRKPKADAGNLKDTRTEIISLSIPSKASGKAVMYNELGETRPFDGVTSRGGRVTVKGLALAGGQIAILKIGK